MKVNGDTNVLKDMEDTYKLKNNKMLKLKKELPNKLSELIEVAIKDLGKAEKSPSYKIDMGSWHDLSVVDDLCYVCFAGGIIAARVESDEGHRFINPDDFGSQEIADKFESLDLVRGYNIAVAVRIFKGYYNYGVFEKLLNISEKLEKEILPKIKEYTEYKDDPKQFKKNMRIIAKELKLKGY